MFSFCAKAVVCVPQLSFFRNFLEKKRFWVDIFGEISVLGESCRKHRRSTSYRGSLIRNRENQDVHQACPFFVGNFIF
ncbi:hypothetical protein DWY90_00645 [Coprococcus sp. AF27-8]|nr:hypothetical protein DWX22_00840 [Coprococcus sp. AF18-48]RJV74321.1 hypothetical protein DWY90_00645 [Coprococcus sp. AF27-8]